MRNKVIYWILLTAVVLCSAVRVPECGPSYDLHEEYLAVQEEQREDLVEIAPPPAVEAPVIDSIEEAPVEHTVGAVDNPVNDVDNSVVIPDIVAPTYTEYELEILSLIIYQEAGSDALSDDTRRKVGSVFLNRVASGLFPDTFEEVATQELQYGCLCWTGIKWPDRASYPQEAHAVARAYTIAEDLLVNGGVLPDNVIWQAEFIQGDGIYCHQDGFYFCYSEVIE